MQKGYWKRYRAIKAGSKRFLDLDDSSSLSSLTDHERSKDCDSNERQFEKPAKKRKQSLEESTSFGSSAESNFSSPSSSTNAETSDESVSFEPNDNLNFGETENVNSLQDDLKTWATKHSCPQSWLSDLLVVLREHGLSLPKDARTVLNVPRETQLDTISGGQFIYFGIEKNVLRIFGHAHEIPKRIELKINIDGVPLWKSSPEQFWPILGKFGHSKVFVIALYYGKGKPNNIKDYLQDFLQELKKLRHTGIRYKKRLIKVTLKCFICDAPARSFLKQTILHTGYYSCERCCVKGTHNGRVVFNSMKEADKRTDKEFAKQKYKKHQKALTPLIDAGIKCISNFPLDYMHLICLGVVKRVLTFLKSGPYCCRLSRGQVDRISSRLQNLAGKLPSDFARQPRGLKEVKRWKATEFRQFLLYTGPVVLAGILDGDTYAHFLSLSIAVSILLNPKAIKKERNVQYSRKLFIYFVANSRKLYGSTFNVYNVHNLLHVTDDVETYECTFK